MRQRRFAVDVLVGGKRILDDRPMKMGGCGDNDGVEFAPLVEHGAVIGKQLGAGDPFLAGLGPDRIGVADRDHFGAIDLGEIGQDRPSLTADPHDADRLRLREASWAGQFTFRQQRHPSD